MFQKDYLMRLLMEYTQTLRYLMGLAKDDPGTLEAVNEKLEAELNLSAAVVKRLTGGALIDLLTLGQTVALEKHRGAYLAALFEAAAQVHQTLDQPGEAYACQINALHLRLHLALEHLTDLPDYTPDVNQLIAATEAYHLPTSTAHLLFRYYEQIGVFAEAEDILFHLLDEEESPELIAEGVAFYKRLNTLPDEALIAGNLPRAELVEGLASLYERQDDPIP